MLTPERDRAPCTQWLVALDLEGVLAPEIWPSVGEALGLTGLQRTTRDTADYAALLQERLAVVADADLTLSALRAVVATLDPLPGAVDLLDSLRTRWPVVVLSDTFEQLAQPLLDRLGRPFTLCHRLQVHGDRITGAELRHSDAKRQAVIAFQGLGYRVVAAGDGHNDLAMLAAADHGCLVRPPAGLQARTDLAVVEDLTQLRRWIEEATGSGAPAGTEEAGHSGDDGRGYRDDERHVPTELHGGVDVGHGR